MKSEVMTRNTPSKWPFSLRLLLSFLLLVVALCVHNTYSEAFLLNITLPGLAILVLAAMYASNYFHREKLIKPTIYLLPAFCVFSFSIIFISLMFGLQSQTIAAYDKCENVNEDRFKWYNLKEVLEFPKDQLKLKEVAPLALIDFKELEDTTNVCHILLIDKTNSVTNSDSLVNDYLRQAISNSFSTDDFDINTPTGDLIAPFIISCVYNNARNKSNEALCVFVYDGIKDDLINVQNKNGYTFQASQLRQSNFFEAYVKVLDNCAQGKKNSKTPQRTSINKMISILARKLKVVDDLKKNADKGNARFQKYKLSIISDFLNSAPQEKATLISNTLSIDELKTYTLSGTDKQNNVYTAAMLVNDMAGGFGNFKGNENIDFTNIKQFQEFCNNLKVAHFMQYNKVGSKTINFHYPYNSYNSNQSSIIKIGISDLFEKSDSVGSNYFIKMLDLDNPENTKQYRIGKGNKLDNISEEPARMGELHVVTMQSQDSLFVIFPNAGVYANDRLKFEIASEDASKNLQTAVAFLPSLSRESARFLIISYTAFLFSVAFILLLPGIFVLWLIGAKRIQAHNPFIDVFCLCLPITLGAFFVYLPFYLYKGIWIWPQVLVLVGLAIFCIPAFIHCLNKNNWLSVLYFDALDFFGLRFSKLQFEDARESTSSNKTPVPQTSYNDQISSGGTNGIGNMQEER